MLIPKNMKENNLNIPQVISVISKVLILGISGSLAVALGVLFANFYPKLDINKPFLIKAYESIISQDKTDNKEAKIIQNSILFNEEQTEISPLGLEILNELIAEIESKQISTIRILSYTEKGEDTPLRLGNIVRQALENRLAKKYRWVIIGYPLDEEPKQNSRVEIRLD
jgi:hypothetical protein